MEQEEWKDLPGYEGFYKISSLGTLVSVDRYITNRLGSRSFKKGRNPTVRLDNFGYLDTRLHKNGMKKSAFMHRLIAEAFIENPHNYCCVNHKDLNRQNNAVDNLEWVSHQGNVAHAIKMGAMSRVVGKSKKVIDTCSGVIYSSIKQAAAACQISYSTCKRILNGYGKNNTCLKFVP